MTKTAENCTYLYSPYLYSPYKVVPLPPPPPPRVGLAQNFQGLTNSPSEAAGLFCRLQVEKTCLFEFKLNKPQYKG